ncbi:MAG: ABC transporter ATP-binding protein [Ancrocorticia sp.]|uniref:ABC transporter ATP-binding protein n=1 Tax=Ancrocorticia sp. TaxID=2593684 RepID=UPI003F8E486E
MRQLGRIITFTKKLTPYYILIVVASVFVTAANIVVPFIIGRATDTAVDAVSGATPVNAAITTALWLAAAFLAIDIFSTVASSIGGYFGDVMSQKMRAILSVRYYEKLLTLPQSYFDGELTGTITSRLNRSIMEVTNFAKSFANSFFTTLLTVVAVLIVSAIYSPWLAILLAIIFPVYLWLTALTSRRWQRLEGQKNEQIDLAGGRFTEVVGQIRVVKSFVQELRELKIFTRRYARTVDVTRDQSTHWHWMDFARRAFMSLVFFGIYAIIFVNTARGTFSVGDMVLLIQLIALARQPIQSMSFIVDTAQHAIAGSKDYFDVMALIPHRRPALADSMSQESLPEDLMDLIDDGEATRTSEASPTSGARPSELVDGEGNAVVVENSDIAVAFDHVTFGYDDDPDVLSDISFEIRRGERVAFVGESGGGKTTLTALLLGLYPVRGGTVRVFGQDVSDISVAALRDSVGVVFQDASLFSGTIRENISYARPNASEAEIVDAATRANAAKFISGFHSGYETLIGERGLKLSGGQKQRISVARAILKDAQILVLDEATSALDTRAERQVQAGLESLMEDRTSLIIAHRLSTIATVDRIITLKDGRIDEVGTPAELAESGGIYASLLALQNEGTKKARKSLKRYEIEH